MPPRQYVPSTCAGQTRSCRSAPIRPMSSWVWTAPGRSTMTTRPVSSAVIGGTRARLGRRRRSRRRGCRRAARPGRRRSGRRRRRRWRWRAGRAPRRRRARPRRRCRSTVSSVPWRGRDMRDVGREQLLGELLGGAAGRVGQLVRDLVEPVARPAARPRCRRRRAPAARRRAGRAPWPAGRPGTSRETRTPGWSACASRVAPQRSSSAANSSAVCLSVPSDSARAMIVATPSRPVGLGVQRRVEAASRRRRPAGRGGGSAARSGRWPACRARGRGRPRAWRRRPAAAGGSHDGRRRRSLVRPSSRRRRRLSASASSSASAPPVGLVDEHRAVVGAQPGRGDRLDLLGGDVQHPLHGGQGELRVAEQHGEPAQFVGAAARPCRAGPATRAPTGPGRAPSPRPWGPPRRTGPAPRRRRPRCRAPRRRRTSSRPASPARARRPAAAGRSPAATAVRSRRTSRLCSREDSPPPRTVSARSAASHSRVPSCGSR